MKQNVKVRMLCESPYDESDEVDLRRARAVLETRRLRNLLKDGGISQFDYIKHLKLLTRYVTRGEELGCFPRRPVSGRRIKLPNVDEILIDYLLGPAKDSDEDERLLGSW